MEDKDVQKQPDKQPGGITGKGFQKGKSGNPGGRPRGAVSITTRLKATLTEGDADTIVSNLIRLALSVPEMREVTTGRGEFQTVTEQYDRTEVDLHKWAVDTIINRLDGKISFSSDLDGGAVSEIIVRYDKQAAHAAD